MICNLTRCYLVDQIKMNEMGEACGTCGRKGDVRTGF